MIEHVITELVNSISADGEDVYVAKLQIIKVICDRVRQKVP